jgi:hypothetical protein
MKYILLCICLAIAIFGHSQNPKVIINEKHTLYYEADLITNELLDNYPSFGNEKYIYIRALGIDVKIYVDTVFKKYTITFKDQDNKEMVMVYKYIRDYFIDSASQSNKVAKIYLMEFQGMRFMLSDFIDIFNILDIVYEEKTNGYTLRHTIEKVRRIKK